HFLPIEGLGKNVIRSDVQRFGPKALISVKGTHHNQRSVRPAAYGVQHIIPVCAGQIFPDCTGVMILNAPGAPGPATLKMVVVDTGRTIYWLVLSPPSLRPAAATSIFTSARTPQSAT